MEFVEADIKEATRDYTESQLLGVGGFGSVYKGIMRGTFVAVKVLSEVYYIYIYIIICTYNYID